MKDTTKNVIITSYQEITLIMGSIILAFYLAGVYAEGYEKTIMIITAFFFIISSVYLKITNPSPK